MDILLLLMLAVTPAPSALTLVPIQVDTPPPMWRREREYPGDNPVFTPYTEAPRLLNRDDIRSELARWYPKSALANRDSATVLLWLRLDTTGYVIDVRVKESGGADFDRAAIHVGGIMHFSPAMNKRRPLSVWIQVPVVFKVT